MTSVFRKAILECQRALQAARGITLGQQKSAGLTEFKKLQDQTLAKNVFTSIRSLSRAAQELNLPVAEAQVLQHALAKLEQAPSLDLLDQVLDLVDLDEKQESSQFSLRTIPEDVRAEIAADHAELQKCLAGGCYRSAVILCGRILETALHRKYFELTGNDLLEKAPGIGLGNVIAKMSERNLAVDPGLANQIHLINQVRVWSVHKKQTPFQPSEAQATAIMLYTMDVVQKLWA